MVKEPPFSETVALFPKTRSETTNSSVQIPEIQSSTLTRLEWQKHEAIKSLSVQHLNSISKHLWLAGRAFTSPVEKFALHRLKAIGFELSLIEDAGLHLLWQDRQIYLKPLPDFLLDYNFWKANLCSSDDRNEADYLGMSNLRLIHLFRIEVETSSFVEGTNGAIGLLLSYTWLIQWESDLKIAQANDLLDKTISYSAWMAFRTSFLSIFHRNQISLPALAWRYDFGNLSLDRINNIWSFSLRRPLNSESAFYGYFNNYRLNNPFFGPMFKAYASGIGVGVVNA
ncbi:MAG: hypothetical protein M1834_003229 [Cirrosporium novae-zelandiae]|nr:MAG: hypothetical protein M1834_003229 [Cirrosporium novae-zelandiae]